MASENPAPELLEQGATLDELEEAARGCTACHLYRNATQTVFGEGPRAARILLVGEQPGDEEDQEEEPFVGPAGRMLDQVLEEAGIDRTEVYVTNLVKHFTMVVAYSLRATSIPSVSVPITWDEMEEKGSTVERDLRFSPRQIMERLDHLGDPFRPVLELEQRLPTRAGWAQRSA